MPCHVAHASSRSYSLSACSCRGFALAAFAQAVRGRALAGFAKDSFTDTDEAIGAVAASGNPLALAVIEALQDGRLAVRPDDKKVFIKAGRRQVLDAATGEPVAGTCPTALKPVRLNNRLRRTVEAALGGLTLLSPDPAKRYRGGAGRVQVARRDALPTRRCGARQGDRRARRSAR